MGTGLGMVLLDRTIQKNHAKPDEAAHLFLLAPTGYR